MPKAAIPENESRRLEALESLKILDSKEENDYDEIAKLAAMICQVPIALVCLVDRDRQWFKSHIGLDIRETSRDVAFCAHAILDQKTLEVEDATKDLRFYDNILVNEDPQIRFYTGVPLVIGNGFKVGTLCVIDKVPRKLKAEQLQALEMLARQVEQLFLLRLKIEELKTMQAAQSDFFAMVNHELKNPLHSIMGYLSILLKDAENLNLDVFKKKIEKCYQAGEYLLELVNDILDMTKINIGGFQIEKELNSLNAVVLEAVKLVEPLLEKNNLRINTNLDSQIPKFPFDKLRIRQVIINLISNAIKFSFEGTVIEVKTHLADNIVSLCVQDQGKGIKEDQKKDIFKKYSSTQSSSIGMGLGLYISKEIAKLHNGDLYFESKEAVGSKFTLELPLTKN